ncbi:glutamate 5-kinase [Lampropedia hyalina DSM 16112]|jgi:glutamate 5-kinase|uniref:Glutamate 5-kinase n=1 Tax=Lampropedia hyalina DSM 16112 TaxID=1122156 RepID=A0A1M5DL46_9BURK|nr:glutamate 5-kinase [Lampropedia hyalina]SHF67670.1 glutamate 5-kinase [Lampropedia hyalina DSM 16112]
MSSSSSASLSALLPSDAWEVVRQARRIVVKVGSSLVTNNGQGVDEQAIDEWCRQLSRLVHGDDGNEKREVIVVSSGAIAEGMKRLGMSQRPRELHELQAAAAVGQMGLVQMYETKLRKYALGSAQVLLTHADMADRERYLNARVTLLTLLKQAIVPVINENDTVVNDEIRFGDNDTLAALVANLVVADLLIILTDQPGFYTADPRKDPHAQKVETARAGDPSLEQMAGGAGSAVGTGGMLTKILAARRAARSGASTLIAWGREPDVLPRLLLGQEHIGSLLVAPLHKLQARKQWIADHLQVHGAVVIDAGAVLKLTQEGKSLLPIGMVAVKGRFSRGDVISIQAENGREVARGLANYNQKEARLLCRHASTDIETLLGYVAENEMVHRDNLVLV